MGETTKSKNRRISEGWFEKYIFSPGIDIGCRHDPVDESFRKWDLLFGDSDATFMKEVKDDSYKTVYASHVLEHLKNPVEGIRNWYRITSSNGHLIIVVPHRDLYEKKEKLPSRWNSGHKSYWLPYHSEEPDTKCLKEVILEAIPKANIISYKVLNAGYESCGIEHSKGEYSIEAIIKKI